MCFVCVCTKNAGIRAVTKGGCKSETRRVISNFKYRRSEGSNENPVEATQCSDYIDIT